MREADFGETRSNRGPSDRGHGEVCLEGQKQIDFMEISVNGGREFFSWDSRDLEETFSAWSKIGGPNRKGSASSWSRGAEEKTAVGPRFSRLISSRGYRDK